ncbi:Ig-like domain-containing protein [Acinetobacter baumannii]|uniref:Ig-like domain-containing protein n=1 Tax=Acinetobacter baumannii TaxID=470 RepID=UPI000A8F2D54|nr:Ig-like domain-containing protein [Acinetobacter baumannii]UMO26962.1 Ig-like domain-containing protein [Acinetobacter baumannii]
MPEIQIIAKDNHKTLVTTEGTSAKLSEASVVLVKVAASDVLVVNREGTNAVIRLKNGETIVIEGFFSGTAEPKDNSLVFQDENGQLIWAKFKDAENDADADSDADADADSDVEPQALLGEDLPAALPAEAPQELVSDVIYQPISSIEPLLYHDAGVNPWLWAAIPLVAGGIIAAASNHDSNDDSSTPTDTTPPATPSVPSGYLDNVGPDQGIKGSGSSTDDTTPGVVISAPGAGETPTLYVDGEKVAASYDPVTGTLTPTTPLADGSHQLTYTLTDAAGNESAQSPAITVTVDTLAPATPSVPSGYLDNVGPDQGIKGSGSSTDDTTPGVVISAPGAGETPTLYVDGEKVAASYDPVTGTLTPTTPLADGSHQLTYTLTDAAGNESAQSPAITVTVDTLAPATPSVPSGYLDNVGPDQGIKGSGSSTDDTTPGVVISAPGAGETPTLYVDGEKVAASYDPVTGTLTPTTPLADGSHQLTYTLTDAAGNESAQSPAITVTVDTLAPATPSVPSGYLDNVGPDQGIKGSGSSTDDTTPGVVISAPGAGETPTLYVDGEKVAASYDPVTGTLTPTTPLADGSHQLTYTLTDAAGNESAQSPAITVTVDTLAPATPSVPSGYLDNVGPDQGIKGSGSSTDDTTPGVVISAPGAGETPTLYVDGEKVAASYDPVTGTLTPTTPLADGSHQLTYTLTDAAGNESAQSPAITVTVDTLAPATPSVPSGYLDNVGPDQGIKGSGSSTDDTTPGVVISAPGAGETPTLYVDGEKVAASYDPVTGTLTPTTPLADGSHQLTYTLTDAAGNESAQSPAITVTVDTTAPVLTISTSDLVLASGEAATITFEFSEPVSEFSVSDVVVSGGVLSNFIQVDANTWTAIFTQSGSVAPSISVADGAYTDIVGNTGKGDVLDGADGFIFNPLAVDLIGEITIPADINNDNILNANELGADKTFTAQITLGSDAAVGNIISVNGINYTVVQADLDAGFITAEIIVTVDGDLSVRAEARDSAGNTDIADTTIKVITVDTTAPITPSAPTGYLDNVGPDQGIKGSGSSTDDTTPGVVISAPGAGETPTLYVDGEKVAASYDPVTGTLTPTTPLADGSHQLTYTLTDAAGNESVQSPALLLTVDTTAPSLVITALDPALTATESTTISFTFSEAVSGFDIDDITPVGGTLSNLVQSTTNPNVWTATFTADGSGAAPSISVAEGAYTDLAGNLGTGDVLDGTDGFVVDTLAPAPVITIDPVTNAITIDFGEAVNAVDGSPLTADALEGLLDIANGTLTGLVDNGDGSFSGTLVPAADFEGDVVVNVPAGIVTDVAGNANLTATESLTVDTLAPGLVITALDPALTATESTTISFTFSEAVSGFDIDDITPVGGTLSNLVQSTTNPNVWTATFTADGSGAAPSISVAEGAYTDLAGNLGTGDVLDGTDGFVVDTLAPAPVITIDPVTNAITIDFGEAVNAVDGSPLTADALEGLLDIANGTLTGLVDNGDGSFSGTLVPAADFEGDVVVNVPAGIVTDVAGNANLTATESLTVDTLAPTLVISATDTNLSLGESTTISFTFSEAVSGFDIDDITPVGGTLSNLVQSTTNPNVWTATFTQDGTLTAPSISVADDAYTDLAGNLGKGDVFDGTDGFVVNTIDAINDNVTFDPGTFVSTIWDAPIIAQDINVLDTSIIGDTSMNVEFSVPRNSADIGTGHEGDVVIQVSQDNLIAVASGFSVLVEYFDGANWVQYTTATTTNGGLIADALGLGVLGIVDDGKTIAVHLTGVPEGQYRVVVQNDSSAIGDLLDDLTLAQLGDQGILLGADNQDAVLDAVETALNGQVLNLGTLVRNVLEPLLNIANAAGETLAVTDIVAAIVKIPLVGSLLGGVDTVLDYIADALVDNLLSVLEFTNVTINGSETYYTTPQVSGNVFDDNGSGADDRGNSDAALVTKVDGVDVPTDGTDAVIKGLYGTLYINKDGVYRYVLNGSVDSNGQVDDFTYTLSDGTHSDTAVLTISVADVIAPKAPIVSSLDETTVTGVAGAAEANSVINVYGGTDSDGDGIPDTLLGTTTANPDGSYTVTLNPAIALGDTVVVTSKDAAGNISTPTIASLHNIVALDDPNQTNYELSTTADRPNISGGIFTLANAGVLGDLIDLDLSATSAPGVTVGTNEQITLTLTASGSTGLDISAVGNLIDAILGGNIGGSLDLIIAKQTSTGSYEVYNTIANAYTLNNNVLTFTASGSQSISLDDAGVYKFILAPNSSTSSALSNLLSLNLLGNLILSSNDVVATINNTDLITGNVLSNDTAAPIGLDLSIVSIKETTAGVDETVVSGTPKVIEGMYGTLTIDSTGAYSYQMTANATALGKVEAFTYTVQDNDGHSKQATIYIRLDSNLVTLDWTGKTGLEEANKLVTQLTADNKASAGTVTTLFDQVLNGSGDSSNSIQVTGSNGVLPTSPPETGSTAIPDDSGRFTLGAGQTAYISFTSILPSNVTQDFGFLGGGNQTSAYNVVIELERDGGTLAFDTQLATWTSTTSGTKYYYKVTNTGNSSANYDLNIG